MKVFLTNCTHNAGVIVARALVRDGHEVVGGDDTRMPFGMHSRHLREQHLLPEEQDERLADVLLAILERERFDVLLPFSGVAAVAARRADFDARTRVLAPEAGALARVVDKAALPRLCAEFGIPAPATYGRAEALARLADGGGSLVVKPRIGRGAGAGIRFATTGDALAAAIEAIERGGGDAVIAEHVPGGTANDRALHLLFDRDSRLIASFVLAKTAQAPPRVGITAAAVSIHADGLIERVLPMLRALRWQGPIDVEWKLDPRDGQPKLIEINPRFSGAIGFPIAIGIDMPSLCVAASAGAHLPKADPQGYRAGVRYINPGPYCRSLPARLRADGLRATASTVRQEWSGRVVMPALALCDPAPLVGKLLRAALGPLARPTRRQHAQRQGTG